MTGTDRTNPETRVDFYYSLAETKRFAEELDGWFRRKLRCILWRQWKRPWTRRKRLMERGLPEEMAVRSAFNQPAHGGLSRCV